MANPVESPERSPEHAEEASRPTVLAPAPGRDPAAELEELLSVRRGETHAVAIQDFPDPDALSSALGYREIARVFDISTDILFDGLISHPENLALVNLLEIELTPYAEAVPLDRYDASVFVDNQGTTTRMAARLADAGVPTFAVIDHHDPQDLLDPIFADIRPVGAAATILTEYLRSGRFLRMDSAHLAHVQLATALMHGLQSETNGFVRAGRAEFAAAEYLTAFVDPDLLERVLCVQKSRGTMDVIQRALGRRLIRGGLSLAGVGFVRWADRDAIPQAADFLLTEENVHTAVVYGLVAGEDGREAVMGSLRTTNATVGVDGFLKKALGKDVRGRHFGGGRSRAGGFEIDLGFLSTGEDAEEEREAKWTLFDRQIRRRLFRAAGLEADRGHE
jgi:nanoRNase/pAp phosphatase (c-di-AMP/oligoRNAs hydrolase)